jgi:hypothetical protein
VEDLAQDREQLGRLCDRLRAMSDVALTRARDELIAESLAGAVHSLCVWAAAAQGVDAPVPRLHPLASGDQLSVIGREFLEWAEAAPDPEAIDRWRQQMARLRAAA